MRVSSPGTTSESRANPHDFRGHRTQSGGEFRVLAAGRLRLFRGPTRHRACTADQRQRTGRAITCKGAVLKRLLHGHAAAAEIVAEVHRSALGQLTIIELRQAVGRVRNRALEVWIEQSVPVLQQDLTLSESIPGGYGATYPGSPGCAAAVPCEPHSAPDRNAARR